MEEKDIQIRVFPSGCSWTSSWSTRESEDYTNRGNIITPLKDASTLRSSRITPGQAGGHADHRPGGVDEARRGAELVMPDWFRELVEEVSFAARASEYVNQASGVSARMSISLMENVLSNMERRAIIQGRRRCIPASRICMPP